MNYSTFSIDIFKCALQASDLCQDQTITTRSTCTTLYDECVGSLTSPGSHYSEDAGDGAYGLSSLSEKSRISNHSFKTLSVGPVWVR